MSRLREASGRSFEALRINNFRIYFIGQLLSMIGGGMQMLALTWLVLELTDSAWQLGFVIALMTIPNLLFGPWTGTIADRVDDRHILVVTSITQAVFAAALGVLVATQHVNLPAIWVLAFLGGFAATFERPAGQALLFELVGPETLSSAVGLNSTLTAASRLLGPSVAGVLIATVGMAACFFVNSISFFAVIIAVLMLKKDLLHPRRDAHSRVRARDGLSYAWSNPVVRRALIAMAVIGMLSYNFAQMVPSMIRFVFDAGPGALGLVQGISAAASILGGFVAASVTRPTIRVVGLAALGFGVMIMAAALSPTLVLFAIIWFPAGLGSGLYLSITQVLLQRSTAPEYQGRVMGLFTMAWIGTTPFGAVIQGFIIERWSARVGLGVAATTAALTALVLVVARTRGSSARIMTDRVAN